MKLKSLVYLTAVTAALIFLTLSSRAQAPAPVATIQWNGVTLPAIVGTPITVNGQTLIIETNQSGGYTITTYGPNGTNSVTPPMTMADAAARAGQFVNANNPANISYYSTNGEWDLSVGGVFAQNSGQAAAQLTLERYGVIRAWPNFSLGAAVLQGNANGQSGTAAGYAFVGYRHPIGDVAISGGFGGGYDNYNKSFMGVGKVEIEYRQNRHLGEYVGVGYAFEGIKTDRGMQIGGGIRYAFRKASGFGDAASLEHSF